MTLSPKDLDKLAGFAELKESYDNFYYIPAFGKSMPKEDWNPASPDSPQWQIGLLLEAVRARKQVLVISITPDGYSVKIPSPAFDFIADVQDQSLSGAICLAILELMEKEG